ncbi:hypothetical protein TNCV_3999851 [Trichonephila clavipes]|nr:hypothetical protein TNCV_3999851 [Trichonephila clavipes]
MEIVVTLDEAWVYLSGCNKRRVILYCSNDRYDRTKWLRQYTEKFPKEFMVVTRFRFIKSSFREAASKNNEWTLENSSKGMESNLNDSSKKKIILKENLS